MVVSEKEEGEGRGALGVNPLRETGAVKSMKVIKMEEGDKTGGDEERLQGGQGEGI